MRYGPFKILEKLVKNDFKINLPRYMCIYYVENVENLKIRLPSIPNEDEECEVLTSIQDLTSNTHVKLLKDIII